MKYSDKFSYNNVDFFEDVKNKMIVIKVKIEEVVEREYDVCLELKIKV